jgi:sterol desaturase/sphingolipid hydroxylase (fatty acid hydroxylase superfamily)
MYRRWRTQASSFDLGRMNMRDLLGAYFSHPAVHLYLLLAAGSLVYAAHRAVAAGPLLLAALLTALAYPVIWYALHRFILHGRFLYRMRMTAPLWKRIHFDHHQDPHRMDVLFGSPLNTVPTILAATLPLGWWVGGPAGAAAAMGTGLLITCGYEFCHCVQHLNFKPRIGVLRRMKELHLAHHFHHEQGNYGITSFMVDRMFGTFYGSVRERPRSPHVFNLGYDAGQAERFPWVAELSGGPPRDGPPRRPGRPRSNQH